MSNRTDNNKDSDETEVEPRPYREAEDKHDETVELAQQTLNEEKPTDDQTNK